MFPPPSYPYPAPGAAPPRRRRSRLLIFIVIAVVVLLVVSVVAYAFYSTSAPAIQVGYLDIWAPDNVCGLNVNPISYYGFNGSTGSAIGVDLEVPNFNATACTVQQVTTNTTGFSVSDVQVPLSIPGNGNESMTLTITSPGSSYSGDVNLVFS